MTDPILSLTPAGGPAEGARIAPLPVLPLFHRLDGRRALVAGSSEGALWKAELLAAAGADLTVLAGSQAGARRFAPLRRGARGARVDIAPRGWLPGDLAGAALAVADLDPDSARRFAAAARAAGAAVNIIDRPDLCDLQFGAIVNRAPIVIGISTDGAAPMLGQSIRSRIEAVLPAGLSAWAAAARSWRPHVRAVLPAFARRRSFWEGFTRLAWADPARPPSNADFEALVRGAARARAGSVTLVGAGPGDPELITLKAVRALQSATVILHDELVGPGVLELARREARRVAVGKTGGGPSVPQGRINDELVRLARAGETVVRLKGGDPLIFGRAAEELEACRAAGIEVSIIPGVSAAQGAAARLGVPLTERARSRRVQFVTGHGADGALPRDIDWAAIGDRGATTIVYMPRRTLAAFVREALGHGLDPETPAVAIASATLPDETHLAAPVRDIASASAALPPGAPVTIIIGWPARRLLEQAQPQARAA